MRYLLLLPLLATVAFPQEAHVRVTKVPAPEKALVFQITLPASLDEVWTAFTTTQGLSTWLAPDVFVDLRKGGEWTVHFPGGATGGGSIVDFKPKSEVVMRAMTPPQFPHVAAERTLAIWQFRAAGPKATELMLRQTGWKEGEEWDKAYEYLATGNAQLLETLYRRLKDGPIDWSK